ncbi:MAG: acetyl-CoA C-acetyltransferase [Polyangiales bacterium]
MNDAVIVATARTPIGRAHKGSLASMRADDLAVVAVRAALAKVPGLDPKEIEDVLMGCAQPAGEAGYNLGRAVAVLSGLTHVPGVTINRYCSSSLQTIRMAAHAIRAGEGDVFVAAGVEAVSRFEKGKADGMPGTKNPRFAAAEAHTAERAASPSAPWTAQAGLPDLYIGMGHTAENVALLEGVSREEMDEYSALSQTRAVAAQTSGFFGDEIASVTLSDGTVISRDDGPRAGTTKEKLAELKPVFRADGRVTAGNACPLNDGAAAVVVMSAARARALGIAPIARVVSSAVTALDPEVMGLGPIDASRRALARAKLSIDDVDLVEINEAFAAQVIPSARHLGVGWEKLNVHGGAIALGHPFGMTGARIATTLLHSLVASGKRIGLETMCVGGGQGMAMIFERIG